MLSRNGTFIVTVTGHQTYKAPCPFWQKTHGEQVRTKFLHDVKAHNALACGQGWG